MWLLFAILIFIIAFFFIKRAEYKREQEAEKDSHISSESLQVHSVVTDVVHQDTSSDESDDTRLDQQASTHSSNGSEEIIEASDDTKLSDFTSLLESLNKQYEMSVEWLLFHTDAALFWHKDNPIITILCLSNFSKGKANSLIYKEYYFNTSSWSWHGPSPKGAATEIKKQLTMQFRNDHYNG